MEVRFLCVFPSPALSENEYDPVVMLCFHWHTTSSVLEFSKTLKPCSIDFLEIFTGIKKQWSFFLAFMTTSAKTRIAYG